MRRCHAYSTSNQGMDFLSKQRAKMTNRQGPVLPVNGRERPKGYFLSRVRGKGLSRTSAETVAARTPGALTHMLHSILTVYTLVGVYVGT